MPVAFYLIPITEPPYSRANPQRPQYVDEIRCNWVGHTLPLKGIYLCKVNTTEEKHADLASRAGVRQIPRHALTLTVAELPAESQTKIQNAMTALGWPYYGDERLRHLLQRVVIGGLFGLPNVSRDTQLRDLPAAVRQRGAALLDKWHIAYTGADTVADILVRARDVLWDPDKQIVEEY